MNTPLPIFSAYGSVATTPEIDDLLASNAPVAMGVSGGKDSSALAISTNEYLDSIGHTGPRVFVHSDLGRVEWTDSLPTCERLAARQGHELIVTRRAAGDMMDRWLGRWRNNVRRYQELLCVKLILPWSTPKMRFCTSEMKSAVIASALIKRFPGQRIISATGIRRQESSGRAKAPVAKENNRLISKKHRTSGIDWNPIIDWTTADVFRFLIDRNFPLHEAYTRHGSSRVSCRFCIMGSAADIRASAAVEEHLPLYREMVGLEIGSTFAFQGDKWLGDVRPDLLDDEMREGLRVAKGRAEMRESVEARIPKHLLYTKGWPTCIPTLNEAMLLANVRCSVACTLGLKIKFEDASSITRRYEELMAANRQRRAA